MKKVIATGALLAGFAALVVTAGALGTAASGVTSTPIASGTLDSLDLRTKIGDWKLDLDTKGQSNLVIQKNEVAPGGDFGWQSHPGPSLVIVTKGASTFYRGDDPTCTGERHQAGTASAAYVDPGGTVHIARNEGTETLELYVVRLLVPGVNARIDEARPGNCPF
jgi:quercetin dioxygenase-like cupin family protein